MKKIFSLLALVSLSLTAASAAHASAVSDEVVVFATHEVRASRHTDAEKRIEQGLAELRAQAGRISPFRAEVPALNGVAERSDRSVSPARLLAAKPANRDGTRS